MVSQQIITPAVYTDWVPARRNGQPSPNGVTGILAYNSVGGTLEVVAGTIPRVVDGRAYDTAKIRCYALGSSRQGIRATGYSAPGGVTTYFALDIWCDPAFQWGFGATPNVGSFIFRDDPNNDSAAATIEDQSVAFVPGQWSRVWARVTPKADRTITSIYFTPAQRTGSPPVVGQYFEVVRLSETVPSPDYLDGSFPSTDVDRYSWLGPVNASISLNETRLLLSPAVVGNVYEVVKLTSAFDEITFRAAPDAASGFVYDNDTLERWYALPSADPKVRKRPNAHGAFGLGQIFAGEARPLIAGQYYGTSSSDAKKARRRLAAMFSDGNAITMSVTDEDGLTESRSVNVIEFSAPFAADFSHFDFDIELVAVDPRRYGATVSTSTGLPTPSSGLVWPLGSAASGKFFDWGTAGELGQVSFTNAGEATTYPRLEVTGGRMLGGFRITEIETGRELTYARTVENGQTVVLDSRTQRAYIGDADVTAALSTRKWYEIPRGATRRYQITPLGSTTGSPILTLRTAPANL